MANLSIYRGDTVSFTSAVKRSGVAVNLTGATLWFTAKRLISDIDANAVIAKTSGSGIVVLSAVDGTYRVDLLPADTASLTKTTQLYYDVQLKESNGVVTTIDRGTLEIIADIRQSSA